MPQLDLLQGSIRMTIIDILQSILRYFGRFLSQFRGLFTAADANSSHNLQQLFLDKLKASIPHSSSLICQKTYIQAVEKAKEELQFLLIYLQSDLNEETEVFTSQFLASVKFGEFLRENNVIFWAGNALDEEGYGVSHSLFASGFPFLALIANYRGSMKVLFRYEGNNSNYESLLESLKTVTNQYASNLMELKREKESRNFERDLRSQQDRAYEESLRKDREKKEKLKQEQEAILKAQREKEEKELILLKKKEERLQKNLEIRNRIPIEPADDASNLYRILIRCPDGRRLARKFTAEQSIDDVYDYIHSLDLFIESDFSLWTNFPKKQHLPSKTMLQDAFEDKCINFFIEELDAADCDTKLHND